MSARGYLCSILLGLLGWAGAVAIVRRLLT